MGARLEEVGRGWRVALAALIGALCAPQTTAYWFGVVVEPLAQSLGQLPSAIGAWLAIGLGANCLCAPISGILVDRFGAELVAALAICGATLGLASVAAVQSSLWEFYIGAVLVFGCSTACSIAFTRAVNETFERDRATILGVTGAGTGLAAVIAPKLVQVLVDAQSWKSPIGVMAVVTALALPFTLWLGKSGTAVRSPISPAADSMISILSRRRLWFFAAALILYGFCFSALLVNFVPILTARGLSRDIAAYYAGGVGLGSLFGKLAVGFAIDRIGVAKTCAIVLVLESLAVLGLALLPATTLAPIVVYVGLAHGMITIALPYVVARLFGIATYGRAYGALLMISGLSSLGPFLFSLAHERIGGYEWPLFGISGILIFAAILWSLLDSAWLLRRLE